jgi:hypothetical protein
MNDPKIAALVEAIEAGHNWTPSDYWKHEIDWAHELVEARRAARQGIDLTFAEDAQ